MAGGRPTSYSEEMLEKARAYIENCNDIEEDKENKITKKVNLPSIEGLAYFLKVNKTTIYEWCKVNEEFSNVIDDLRAKQANMLLNKGLSGDYNPTIAKVLLTKHGYTDKTETDITSNGETLNSLLVKFIDGKNN